MKRRVTTFLVCLSALLCLAAMVAWGVGIAGKGFDVALADVPYNLVIGQDRGVRVTGFRGAILVALAWDDFELLFRQTWHWSGGIWNPQRYKIWESISIGFTEQSVHLQLPYWLLILLFATAPALRWRRDYVARREKKLLGEAVAQKRAEHPHLDIKEPRE